MSKGQLYKTVGVVLLFSLFVQALTAVIMFLHIRVPHVQLVFKVHTYNGMFMFIVAGTHIVLNWGWIKANFLKKK